MGLLILGYIGAVAGTAVILAFAGFALVSAFDSARGLVNYALACVTYRARREVAAELLRDRYWFSEDKKTTEAIRLLAQAMLERGHYTVSDVRDEWRKSFEEKAP